LNYSDLTNGFFELGGGVAVWANVRALYHDKRYAGCRLAPMFFFCAFSLWNLWFYPHLGQIASTVGGAFLGLGNLAYVVLMMTYRKRSLN
jgi:hypothetical protein